MTNCSALCFDSGYPGNKNLEGVVVVSSVPLTMSSKPITTSTVLQNINRWTFSSMQVVTTFFVPTMKKKFNLDQRLILGEDFLTMMFFQLSEKSCI